MGMLTDITKITLGDRENRQQSVVVIPAQNVANSPGILGLQSVSGTTVTTWYIWPNTSGVLRYGSTFPTSVDSDGAAVGAAASVTLDQAYDNGASINGAISSGTAIKLGGAGASDNVSIYHDATDLYFAVNTGDLKITAQGGDVDFADENLTTTGTISSGAITIPSDNVKLSIGASGATDAYLQFNGTSLQFYDSDYGSTVTLKALASGNLSNATLLGDTVLSDGKLTWTDAAAEIAGAFTFSNVTVDGIDILEQSLTTASAIHVRADAVTSGSLIHLQSSAAGWSGGYFLNCTNDGSASVFGIGVDGAVTIAGTAAGTAALTLTLGDVAISSGCIGLVTTADAIAADFRRNHATSTAAVVHLHQDHSGSTGPVLDIAQDATGAAASVTIASAGTGSAVNVTNSVVTGTGMTLIGPASQTASQLILDGTTGSWVGAATTGQLHIQTDGALAADASCLRIVSSGNISAANDGYALEIVETGNAQATSYAVRIASTSNEALHVDTGTSLFDETVTISIANAANINAFSVTQADSTNNKDAIVVSTTGTGYVLKGTVASVDGKGLGMIGCADQTTSLVTLDGVTGNWLGASNVGMLNLTCDGTLAHANASLLYIAHSGAVQTNQLGSSLRINDSSTTATNAYAAYMESANNNILRLTGASASKNQLRISGPASQTASMLILTSTFIGANDTGALHVVGTGNLAHTGASLVRVTSSGTMQAGTEAILLNLEDTGTAAATSYCVRIDSTNNEALNVSTGKVLFAENLTVSSGGVTLTADDITVTEGKIALTSTRDEVSGSFVRNHATSTSAVVEIENTHTGATGPCLLIDQKATGNAMGIQITTAGDYAAIDITASAARTGNVINVPMANQLAETAIDITGAAVGTSGEGIVHLDLTGVLAGNPIRVDSTGANAATGQLVYLLSTGQQASATNGVCLYAQDTGTARATSYTVYIASTNNEALYVDTGLAKFDEGPEIQYAASAATDNAPTQAQMNTAFGITAAAGYNGFIGVLNDSDHVEDNYLCFVSAAAWYWVKGTVGG